MEPIPAGKYVVRIERAGKLIAKTGKAYWSIDYRIIDGDYSDRIINVLCWNEQSFNNHIETVHRYVKSQGFTFEEFPVYFERFDNVKYNRLMPRLLNN